MIKAKKWFITVELSNGVNHYISRHDLTDNVTDLIDQFVGEVEQCQNESGASRYSLIRSADGFMAYDHDCDEYLEDEDGNNLFDSGDEANKLIEDAVFTNMELRGDLV